MMESLAVSSASATGNPRNKTALKPGRSLMDWIRLTNSAADLSGVGNRLRDVTPDELARHNKREDAWMAIRGLVYNVTAYFEFHPGGEEELLRGAGIDATDLFDQVHKWVNYESMLKKCLVGRLKSTAGAVPIKAPPTTGRPPMLPPPSPAVPSVTSDWMQGPDHVSVIIYTRKKNLDPRRVSLALDDDGSLALRICCEDQACDYRVRLANSVEPTADLKVSPSTGKVEVVLKKKKQTMQWVGLQWPSLGDVQLTNFKRIESPFFRKASLLKKEAINHNVYLFTLAFRIFDSFDVPIGHHVQLKIRQQDGSEIIRSFTPVTLNITQSKECPTVTDTEARLYFLVKIYPCGPFTSTLNQLKDGCVIEVSDPLGSFDVELLQGKRRLIAFAAGTGVTPMVRLVLHCLESERQASLVFFNRKAKDIIWREELNELKTRYKELFDVWHVLSEPEDDWQGLRGRISQSILASTVGCDVAGSLACVCGPSQFTEATLRLLDEAGYDAVHAFTGQ